MKYLIVFLIMCGVAQGQYTGVLIHASRVTPQGNEVWLNESLVENLSKSALWWPIPKGYTATQYTFSTSMGISDLATTATYTNSGGMRFNGSDQRMFGSYTGQITSSFMVASWVWPLKTLAAQNDYSCWINTYRRAPNNATPFFLCPGNADFIRAGFHDTAKVERSVDTPTITGMVSNWWWVALTFDDPNNTLTIWTNGAVCTNKTGVTQTPFVTTQDLTFGVTDTSGFLSYWAGVLDDVIIYRGIDTNALVDQYNVTKSRHVNP